jgi:hypothetical protein
VIGGIIGGVVGGISGAIRGENPWCRAGLGALAGAIVGAISTTWPPAAKCIAGLIASIFNTLAGSLCQPTCKPPDLGCLILGALYGLITGCAFAGLAGGLSDAILNALKIVMGSFGVAGGSICADIRKDQPLGSRASARAL